MSEEITDEEVIKDFEENVVKPLRLEKFKFKVTYGSPILIAPSKSPPKQVKVKPKPAPEPTILTLETDKDEYISGEKINITGKLTFQSDGAPLPDREIIIYRNGQEIGKTKTDSDGKYTFITTAPETDKETAITFTAEFKGDA
jgi:hypothetical protein